MHVNYEFQPALALGAMAHVAKEWPGSSAAACSSLVTLETKHSKHWCCPGGTEVRGADVGMSLLPLGHTHLFLLGQHAGCAW